MQIDSLHLENAYNVFGKKGYSGGLAKKDERAYYKVVRQCIAHLKSKGFCECWYDEQAKDIQNVVKFSTERVYVENEIFIRRK